MGASDGRESRDPEGRRIFGEPRGEPARPLLEAALAFALFYLAAYAPASGGSDSLSTPAYHLRVIAANLPRALFLLYLMATGDGLAAFGIQAPRPGDLLKGLLAAFGTAAAALPSALGAWALGLANPLLRVVAEGPRASLSLAPLILVSVLTIGYSEELFFRAYLLRRLERAGLSPAWAILAASLLFGGAHGAQGAVGLAAAASIGLWLGWRWRSGRDIHEIALAHALYDAAVLAVALYP
jgi:membrane protease YdiL (CAAX protease family)